MSTDISKLREQIDSIDTQVLTLLAQRFALMPDVIAYKKARGLAIQDPTREAELISAKQKLASELGVSEEFAQKLFELIMSESRRLQE